MKTKLGISVGLLAAITYLMGLFSGYTVLVLIAGYVLICEEDTFLKKSAVKAFLIMLIFSVIYYVIGFLPSLISLVSDLLGVFGVNWYPSVISSLTSFFRSGISIIEDIIMIVMALLALKQKSINIGFIDKMFD